MAVWKLVLWWCRSCIGTILLRFYGCSFLVIDRKVSFRRHSGPLAFTVFLSPLLWCYLNPKCSCCIVDGARHPMVGCSPHFDQLWIPVMVPICCRKKLLWWGIRWLLISQRSEWLGWLGSERLGSACLFPTMLPMLGYRHMGLCLNLNAGSHAFTAHALTHWVPLKPLYSPSWEFFQYDVSFSCVAIVILAWVLH